MSQFGITAIIFVSFATIFVNPLPQRALNFQDAIKLQSRNGLSSSLVSLQEVQETQKNQNEYFPSVSIDQAHQNQIDNLPTPSIVSFEEVQEPENKNEYLPSISIDQAHQIQIGNTKIPGPHCKSRGQECLVAEDCCSFRCLSFAARCVS